MTHPKEYNKHKDTFFFFKVMPEYLRSEKKRKIIYTFNDLSRLCIALGTRMKLVETCRKEIIFCGVYNSEIFDKCLKPCNKLPKSNMPSKVSPELLHSQPLPLCKDPGNHLSVPVRNFAFHRMSCKYNNVI